MGVARRWPHEEDAAIREHYAAEGMVWPGWATAVPGRTADAISKRARSLGLRVDHGRGLRPRKPEPPRPPRPATCGECRLYREGDEPGCGRCMERHARGMFQGAPPVMAHYDASLCEWGERV